MLGVIIECQQKRSRFIRNVKITQAEIFRKNKTNNAVKYNNSQVLEAVVLEIPYTLSELGIMKDAKLRRIMKKAISSLRRLGISKAVISRELKMIYCPDMDFGNFRIYDGSHIFFDYLSDAISHQYGIKNAKNSSLPLIQQICIKDTEMSRLTEDLVQRLCYMGKYISIYTTNISKAKDFAKSIFFDFGLNISVSNMESYTHNGNSLVIDVDNASLITENGNIIKEYTYNIGIADLNGNPINADIPDIISALQLENVEIIGFA